MQSQSISGVAEPREHNAEGKCELLMQGEQLDWHVVIINIDPGATVTKLFTELMNAASMF
mgnify:FL=1